MNLRAAAGAEAGHGKRAQGRGLGLGHWTAHGREGGGGGGGGEEMNEDEWSPLPLFYKLVGQLKGPGSLRATVSLISLL